MAKESKSRGRPKQDRYNIADMIRKIDDYTDEAKLPILKECCLDNSWEYDYVMKLKRNDDELRQSIKRLLDKKEIILEKLMLTGKANVTACIFTLKQPTHGWSDKHEVQIETDTAVNIILERE